ncbi:MAG: polymer-forming cytoskeletal protein [Steroidobacteraceae bacterium]
MFGRRKTPGTEIDTLIGRAASVSGDLDFTGGLHLDGHVAGNVRGSTGKAATLSVSDSGCIEGSVDVPVVVLNGKVKGDIVARERVILGATARVEGNVHYGVIETAPGAQIQGKLVPLKSNASASTSLGASLEPAGAALVEPA